MRKIILTSVCMAAIAFVVIAAASAQTSNYGAPAGSQTNVTGATSSSKDAMAMTKKKKAKKPAKKSSTMEKKM